MRGTKDECLRYRPNDRQLLSTVDNSQETIVRCHRQVRPQIEVLLCDCQHFGDEFPSLWEGGVGGGRLFSVWVYCRCDVRLGCGGVVTGATFGKAPMALTKRFIGTKASTPRFALMGKSLDGCALGSKGNGCLVLGVFPDVSANIYTASMHGFGRLTTGRPGAIILTVSGSLPFTRKHFYAARNVAGIVPLSSCHCASSFTRGCNMLVASNPLTKLLTHSIMIVSPRKGIICARLIPRVARRPGCRTTLGTMGWGILPREVGGATRSFCGLST